MEKVVISGIGGSFPCCEDLEEFQKALYEQSNLITNVEPEEWPGNLHVPHYLGRDKNYLNFDFSFMSINYDLANSVDKMTKSLIRNGYTAILDAGYSPSDIRGRNVNVYMHTALSDDEARNCGEAKAIKMTYYSQDRFILGVAKTMQSNRISAYFDFNGTSEAYQGSFDNVFEALKIAAEDVARGKCEGCLVGAINLCVNPQASMEYKALGLLTKDPINRPLDETANGYIRADSTVVFFIQKASEARRNYAEIVNIGSIYIGNRLGNFMTRDEKYMIELLQETYRQCGLKPNDISYLETGSCAKKDLDTQELNVICKVFAPHRSEPLPIGSVVGNTGFTEACSGFVGMVKAILALRTGLIAPTLHVNKPNEAIGEKLQIVTENTPVKDYVAINAIGLYGGFSHAILKRPETKSRPEYPVQDILPRLYMMAVRNVTDVNVLFKKLASVERSKYLASTMCDVFRKEIKGYIGRCFAIYNEDKMMVEQSKTYEGNKRPVWFLFSGMGSQWKAMGKDLIKFPIFANAVAKCDAILKEHNVDIVNILTNEDDTTIFDNILNSFVGITTVQIGLVDMLHAMGIQPEGIIGHSHGELACSYADGCLTAEQTIYVAFLRGKASNETELISGKMAAVGLGHHEVTPMLPEDIEVACHNSSTSCTISGPSESVNDFVNTLTEQGIFARTVNVSNIAYHSRYIRPLAPLHLKYLQQAITEPKPRSSKWISTSIQEQDWNSELAKYVSAEYFTNNLLSTVYFEEGARHIPKNAIIIEISPHALLGPIVRKSLDPDTDHISLTNRSKAVDNIQCLLEGIGNLYLHGCEPNVNAIYPPIEYPIPANVPSISHFMTWDFSVQTIRGLEMGSRKCWFKTFVLGVCSKSKYHHLLNYKIGSKFLIPPAGYISLVLELFVSLNPHAKTVAIENFRTYEYDMDHFLKGNCDVTITITRVGGSFAISAEDMENVWCTINCTERILATGEIKIIHDKMTANIPEWTTTTDIEEKLEFDTCLKNLAYSSRNNQCDEFLSKHSEGFSADLSSKLGRTFDLIDSCLKVVSIAKSDDDSTLVPYCIQSMMFNMETIREYKQGKTVRVFYDPMDNELTSSVIIMKTIRTKEILLDNPDHSNEHNNGPIGYLTSMKSGKLEDININFIGISSQASKDKTIVDFSGSIKSTGNRIMGIVSNVKSMVMFDRTLVWDVPSSWSLDQAVTVPIVYCMAYLCIVKEKSSWRDETFKRTLIHCGDTPLGEACIALALAKMITVYTTVGSEEGRRVLLDRFPQLSPSHIFLNTNYNYFIEVKLKHRGEGVHQVINPMKDPIHFEFSWNSLSENGELIQIGVDETKSFGMYRFMYNQSVFSLNSNVLLNQDETVKKQMYEYVNNGIRIGVIQPVVTRIERNVQGRMETITPRYEHIPEVKMGHIPAEKLGHGPEKNELPGSYQRSKLEESAGNSCYEVISLNVKETLDENNNLDLNNNEYSSCMLKDQSESTLTLKPHLPLLNTDNLPLDSLGNIHSEIIYNNETVQTTALLKQVNSNLPCLNHLERLHNETFKTHQTPTFSTEQKKTYRSSLNNLEQMEAHLPSLDHLEILHSEISKIQNPIFVEELSLSLKKDLVHNLQPVFFIPGLSGLSLKNFITKMIHPSFLGRIPVGWSLDDIVEHLYKSLKQVQSKGPYTLVAESWGGVYGFKLAEYMDNKGDSVNLVLLEGSPYNLNKILTVHEDIFESQNSLVEYFLQKHNLQLKDLHNENSLTLSCKIILDRVNHVRTISKDQKKLKCNCSIVTCDKYLTENNIQDLYKVFTTVSAFLPTPVVSPFQFSTSDEVVRFVHENVAIEWW